MRGRIMLLGIVLIALPLSARAETRVAAQTDTDAIVDQFAYGFNNYAAQSFFASSTGEVRSIALPEMVCGPFISDGHYSYTQFSFATTTLGGYLYTGTPFPVVAGGLYYITNGCNAGGGGFIGTARDTYLGGEAGHMKLPGQFNTQFVSNAASGNALLDWAFAACTTDDCTLAPAEPPVPEPCTQECNDNVLFIPGIEASRLYEPQVVGNPDKKLWEPMNNADVQELFMNPDGTSVRNDIYVKEGDVLDEVALPVVGSNIYKSFIARMDGLKADDKIADWEAIPYDWRLSLADVLSYGHDIDGRIHYSGDQRSTSTPYIIQELRRLARSSRTGKVTIIAHSNGGLVTKALMRRLEDMHDPLAVAVDRIIFVAVPQVGTPSGVSTSLHGDGAELLGGIVLTKNTARAFAQNAPMAYNLMPSAAYFSSVSDPVVRFDSSLPDWQLRYGATIGSEPGLRAFLVDSYGRVDPQTGPSDAPILMSGNLASAAQSEHADLDSWEPASTTEVIQIAGWGVPTVSSVLYKKRGTGVTYEATTTIDGDGTVVAPSALWLHGAHGQNQRIWVDLQKYNLKHQFETLNLYPPYSHANVLEISSLLDFLSSKVTSTNLGSLPYLSEAMPDAQTADSRLHFTLHSPLTLNAYDYAGRHTGVSTTTGQIEEEIPGTYYREFGETKQIFSDATGTLNLLMQGYATGTFTLDAEQLKGDTRLSATEFKDIATSANTSVSLAVPPALADLGSMRIDTNGDGSADIVIAPKIGGVAMPDVTVPTTTVSLVGIRGAGGWYISDVTATIVATDTESGVESTRVKLDGVEQANSTLVISEGIHTLTVSSTDKAGNIEQERIVPILIDKTQPEAKISFDATARRIVVAGIDTLSSTTVQMAATSTRITDAAGHSLVLIMNKPVSTRDSAKFILAGLVYDGRKVNTAASGSFEVELSRSAISEMEAELKALNTSVNAEYEHGKTHLILYTNGRAQKTVRPGIVIPFGITDKGKLLISY